MEKDTILATVSAYFPCLQAMDVAGWCELFTEEGVTYDPVGNPPSKVQEKAGEFFGLLAQIFDGLELNTDQIFISGNGAAVKWTMKAIGKNGRAGKEEGISTFDLDETGKIRAVYSYWDDAALMAQIKG